MGKKRKPELMKGKRPKKYSLGAMLYVLGKKPSGAGGRALLLPLEKNSSKGEFTTPARRRKWHNRAWGETRDEKRGGKMASSI